MAPARRTPLAIGWHAAKANAVPAFILQAAMFALLIGYYVSPAFAALLDRLAQVREQHGVTFVVIAAVLAGAIVPELFVVAFFQRFRLTKTNARNLAFTIPTWALDGLLVDLLYRANAHWFGDAVTLPVVAAKMLVDQLGYNVFFAAPVEVLVYEWKNRGFSWQSVRRAFTWANYREQIVPMLLATWAVWIPIVAVIYCLPLALQFPLFSIALTFWVLLLTYMTNRFAENIDSEVHVPTPRAESV